MGDASRRGSARDAVRAERRRVRCLPDCGQGEVDVVAIPEWLSHQDARWDVPAMATFFRRLGEFARVTTFDKRGCGLSDPVPLGGRNTLEEWVDDYPWGVPDSILEEMAGRAGSVERVRAGPVVGVGYGTPYDRAMFGAKAVNDEAFMKAIARWRRMTSSPSAFAKMNELVMNIDVRSVLPTLDVPTLVLHRGDDNWTRIDNGRYLAEHIQGARFVELDGDAHAPYVGDVDALAGEVEEFLTGNRREPHDDRVLATVMFCDVVGSTERAAALGDGRWAEILVAHNNAVRRQLERFRGVEVNTTGDGFVATFDGPARAIRCAVGIRHAVRTLGLEVRTGLHTGEVVRLGDDISGVGVHIAARVLAAAAPGEVLLSRTVADLITGSGIELADRGEHELRGVPGCWRLYAVVE